MSKPKLTPWFKGEIRPAHVGVYERNDSGTGMEDGTPNYSLWDGTHWNVSSSSRDHASSFFGKSQAQNLPWRGLASEPKVSMP